MNIHPVNHDDHLNDVQSTESMIECGTENGCGKIRIKR